MNKTYLVAGYKPWNEYVFQVKIKNFSGQWHYISQRDDLTLENIATLQPRYIFFLHWSWQVPEKIIAQYECVCFHMSDVPYGRGGSPLQNLIVRGHRATKLTALQMVQDFDAGPVYLKVDLSLEGSSAEEIYIRASNLSAQMIEQIITEEPLPQPQTGEATIFKRRKPNDSLIPELSDLQALHDFIRMLDAGDYPSAFLEHAGFRYEFSRAALYDGRVMADVNVTPLDGAS